MAMLLMEGFEGYGDTDDLRRRHIVTGVTSVSYGTGRYGGRYVALANSQAFFMQNFGTPTSFVLGFALRLNGSSIAASDVCVVYSVGGEHLVLRTSFSGHLLLDRGSTNLDTSSEALLLKTWYYIEFKATIGNTGSYEIRVDGINVMSNGTADTQNGGLAQIDQVKLGLSFTNQEQYDDVYLLDSSGLTNNDFLGEIAIETMVPDGDGNRNQFTQLSGLTNYEMVDDGDSPDDDTTYNHSATLNDDELYTYAAMTYSFDTVYAVQIRNHVRKENAGERLGRALIRSNTDEAEGDSHVVATDFRYYDHVFETDPQGGGAWTETRINAMEGGFTIEA